MLEGHPGTGKTTFALQFCHAGVEAGERVLYVTLSQRADELAEIATSHGWDLEGIDVIGTETSGLDLHAGENTLFHSDDVDLEDAVDTIMAEVTRLAPQRLVLDSAAEVRLLSDNAIRARRRFLALKHALGQQGTTTLLLNDHSSPGETSPVYSIMHGVIRLEREEPEYGHVYRRLTIPKIRGVHGTTGYHDFRIVEGGLEVYPSLTVQTGEDPEATESRTTHLMPGLVGGLDDMIGGGLDAGSSCVLIGVSGTGKSSIAASYAVAAARRGTPAAIYTFDERRQTLLERMEGLSLDARAHSPTLQVSEFSPSTMSTGRFVDRVRRDVEAGVELVVIDSLTGFTLACPGDSRATTRLHDLLSYLSERRVTAFVTVPQHGLLGGRVAPQIDVSFIADTVILLQHFEDAGRVRKAITVVKRRRGDHDRSIRELVMSDQGIVVGAEISRYLGVMTGEPRPVA